MCAALSGINRVSEGVNRFGVRRGPLHGHLALDVLVRIFFLEVDDVRIDDLRLLGGVEMLDVIQQAARVHVGDAAEFLIGIFFRISGHLIARSGGCWPLISQGDAQILIEEGHLVKTLA